MHQIPDWSVIEVECVREKSRLISSRSIQPLKILNPQSHSKTCHVVTSSFGGGMVAGDRIKIKIKCRAASRLFLSSQANTKIYKSEEGNFSGQIMEGELDKDSFAVIFPNPVVPQEKSSYRQVQNWQLNCNSLLLTADWLHSGRMDIGEKYIFDSFFTEVKISKENKPIVLDRFNFDPKINFAHSSANFGSFQTILSFYLAGNEEDERFKMICTGFLKIKDHYKHLINRTSLLCAFSKPKEGVAILRLSGKNKLDLNFAGEELMEILKSKYLLGFNPWKRKY